MTEVVLADSMPGVRDGLRWLLAAVPGVRVRSEAGTVAQALEAPGAVVVAGLHFPDGTAEELIARSARPVVVWTFLPADERSGVDLTGAAAVVRAGRLAAGLPAALTALSPRRDG